MDYCYDTHLKIMSDTFNTFIKIHYEIYVLIKNILKQIPNEYIYYSACVLCMLFSVLVILTIQKQNDIIKNMRDDIKEFKKNTRNLNNELIKDLTDRVIDLTDKVNDLEKERGDVQENILTIQENILTIQYGIELFYDSIYRIVFVKSIIAPNGLTNYHEINGTLTPNGLTLVYPENINEIDKFKNIFNVRLYKIYINEKIYKDILTLNNDRKIHVSLMGGCSFENEEIQQTLKSMNIY